MTQLVRPDAHAEERAASDGRRRIELTVLLAIFIALGFGIMLSAPQASAKQKFMSGFAEAFPAAAGSALDSCLLCHTDPVRPRESNLNNYGQDWEDGDYGDKDYLAPNLLNLDSDGDGVTNNAEIQQLSLPGDPSSSAPPTTTTTLPGTPPDGQGLYAARCSACHGPDGGDLSGTNLGRSSFITITVEGQGGMPAQSNLSDEEAGAIWDYVTETVPPTTTTLPGATTTTTTPLSGSVVWAQECAACHGPNGGNVVPTASSRSQLVSVITSGIGSMRGFPELGSAQIGNLADYILSFGPPTTTTTLPGATTSTTIPRSGAVVYAASCALCHGPSGGNLVGHTLGLSEIVSITNVGVGTMPGYSGSLSGPEISNVAAYIASFGASSGVTTTTLPAGTPPSGSTLYMQNCSSCHGLHGEGGSGGAVDETILSRSEIISVTESGTSGMPAYGSQLSSAEIAAIADHILGLVPSGTSPTETVDPGGGGEPPQALAEGHALFGQFCAACHGAQGEGGPGGPVAGIDITDEELIEIIRDGVGSMPGFTEQMSESEFGELVAFSVALAADAELMAADTTTTTRGDGGAASFEGVGSLDGLVRELGEPAGEGALSAVVLVAAFLGVVVAGGAAFAWMRAARNLVG